MATGEYAKLNDEEQIRANTLCNGCKHRGLNGDCLSSLLKLDNTSLKDRVKEGLCRYAAQGNYIQNRTLVENPQMIDNNGLELRIERPKNLELS